MPNLEPLNKLRVENIKTEVIDRLVHFWVKEMPLSKRRLSFDKELDLLKVVLNFYRMRRNPGFVIPIFKEHYEAGCVARSAKHRVRSLKPYDLGRFLNALKRQKNPLYFPLALSQFCLGLRIGEACGLNWPAIDFGNKVVRIEWTVVWDHENWEPRIKNRPKNGNARVLVIPDMLVAELKKLFQVRDPNVDLVFHNSGRPLIRKSIGRGYNRALTLIGVTDVSGTHLMRKTSATQACRITGDFYAVSRLLDHSNPDVTMKYVEEVDDQRRKVAQALNDVAESVLNGAPVPQSPAS